MYFQRSAINFSAARLPMKTGRKREEHPNARRPLRSDCAAYWLTVAVCGCVGGNTQPVKAPQGFSLEYAGTGTAAVAAHDQRAEVVSGEHKEILDGHQRFCKEMPRFV